MGIDQSNGLQVGISGTLPMGPESSEIKLSVPSIGVNGSLREVVCIGNLYEKTDYGQVISGNK